MNTTFHISTRHVVLTWANLNFADEHFLYVVICFVNLSNIMVYRTLSDKNAL